jgi:hypothetical protein
MAGSIESVGTGNGGFPGTNRGLEFFEAARPWLPVTEE